MVENPGLSVGISEFAEFGVVENFVYRARITVMLILQSYSAV